jgi:hypothetical protein
VRGLYVYEAQGDDEIAVTVGGIITLTPNGESYGDGWYEGVDSNGRQVRAYDGLPHVLLLMLALQGVFPSNYVEFV